MLSRSQLQRILSFLGFSDVPDGVMNCVMANKEGSYHRQQRPLGFDPFPGKLQSVIDRKADQVYRALKLDRPPRTA